MSRKRSFGEAFDAILYERLLPEFCNDPSRGYPLDCFRRPRRGIHEFDAMNFLRAWRAGLVEHVGRGTYRAPLSAAKEQFFWTSRNNGSIVLTLWLEPVITVATLARLHFDHGWPRHLIGMQSADWAFDVVAHRSSNSIGEAVACEVKKTEAEIATLVDFMQCYGQTPGTPDPEPMGKARNAFRKVEALRRRRPPVFWAVGPGGSGRTFRVDYSDRGHVYLSDADDDALSFHGDPAPSASG